MVRLVTYNIHFGKRLIDIISWINRQTDADIICLQEFPEHRISDCMPIIQNGVYDYRFAPSLHRRKKVYGQLTMFRKNRVQLISASTLPLTSTRLDRLSFGHASRRSCLFTKFRIQRKKFIVANIQLSCLASNSLRYSQLRHIIHALKTTSISHIIAGDFNVSSLLGRKKLFMLMKNSLYETVENRMATHRLMIIKHQTDYVFAKKCRVQKISVERIRFSDHYPVTADILLSQ